MKNRVKKMILLAGIMCVMGCTLCACQGAKKTSDMGESARQEPQTEESGSKESQAEESSPEEPQTVGSSSEEPQTTESSLEEPQTKKNSPEESQSDKAIPGEPQADGSVSGDMDNADSGPKSGADTKVSQSHPEAEITRENWKDMTPDLEGDIKGIQDGQFTVVEAISEETDDGGAIMVAPGDGDDSGFNKVTVTYDENTRFSLITIYNGGADYDMSEITAADMAAGQSVEVWGEKSADGWAATQICIVKVK